MPCRFNSARVLTARIVLESYLHKENSFVTLTYDGESLPRDGSVSVRELSLFVKRLRALVDPLRVRYFGVGEYGDTSWRPHYHLAVFGLLDQSVVESAWGRGLVHCGEITAESARYLAGYSVKRLTNGKDERLAGRAPEFARMSLRPGLGAGAIAALGEAVTTRSGAAALSRVGDVPGVVRIGGKVFPVGRYLKGKLREYLGMDRGVSEEVRSLASRAVYLAFEESGLSSKEFIARRESKRIQGNRRAVERSRFNRLKRKV